MKSILQLCLIVVLCFSAGSFAETENDLPPEPAKLLVENDSVQQNKETFTEKDTLQKQSAAVSIVNDTIQKQNTASLTEKDTLQKPSDKSVVGADSLKKQTAVSQAESDAVQKKRGKKEKTDEVKKLKLAKHDYGKRNRIGLAIGMMAFLAIIMATSQQWNPD